MRLSPITLAALLLMVLPIAACAPAEEEAASTEADVEALNQVREQEATAFIAGDPDGLVAVMTDDCLLMPPGEPLVSGHEAVRSWYAAWYATLSEQFQINARYPDSEIEVVGDWAIERYAGLLTLTPKAGGDAVEQVVKGIHIYRRQPDGGWRIAQDIWNSDSPPPGAP